MFSLKRTTEHYPCMHVLFVEDNDVATCIMSMYNFPLAHNRSFNYYEQSGN